MTDMPLPKYRGRLIRHPAPPELAIDPRDFGYLDPESASFRRLTRAGVVEGYRSTLKIDDLALSKPGEHAV